MNDWAPRRFWTSVDVRGAEEGFRIALDDRPVRTPYKSLLVSPTAALAEAIAEEWRAQGEKVNPLTMPFTRALNSAIDKVSPNPGPVAEMIAGYGATDLLCYRATHPLELIELQAATWDPYLDWASVAYGARLKPVFGVMPEDQEPEALRALETAVSALDPFALTSLHEVVTLTGSLVLGLAGLAGKADATALWSAARLDERWQAEQWGEDSEAEALARDKGDALRQALRFYALTRSDA